MRSMKLFTLFAIFAVLTVGLFSRAVTAQTELTAERVDLNPGTNTPGPVNTLAGFIGRWTAAENQVILSANASISGRVMTSNGNGIRNASLTLSGGTLTQPVTIQTGPFGSYIFQNLQVGQTYFLQVSAKRFRFSSPSRLITLQDNLDDMNFIANPQD